MVAKEYITTPQVEQIQVKDFILWFSKKRFVPKIHFNLILGDCNLFLIKDNNISFT